MAKEKDKKAKKSKFINFFKRTGAKIASFFKGIVLEIKKLHGHIQKTSSFQYRFLF